MLPRVLKKILVITFSLFNFLNAQSAELNSNQVSPTSSIGPENVALVVNDADLNSVKVANYYSNSRHIPTENIVHISIKNPPNVLNLLEFNQMHSDIERQLNSRQQVILLAWTAPYAVECNSITAALTFGFDAGQCANTCAPGKLSPYFNSASKRPFDDMHIRPSMLLPNDSFAKAKALIDRGVLSDNGVFHSTAYYLRTSDTNRNSRALYFPPSGLIIPNAGLSVVNINSESLFDAHDVMIYQIGLASVDGLDTLGFVPGALADHLTSFGGDLNAKNGQMSALRWLEAGATASYGTVSEPCNYWQKFPNPSVLLKWYVSGATAIEAYWKSVAWPTQGLFIGEPLACSLQAKIIRA
jgi:uncharacterized protein (TIGR03790 family)